MFCGVEIQFMHKYRLDTVRQDTEEKKKKTQTRCNTWNAWKITILANRTNNDFLRHLIQPWKDWSERGQIQSLMLSCVAQLRWNS